MKLLLLFFLVGVAYAFTEVDESNAERVLQALFVEEAEEAVFSQYAEDDVKTDLGKKLREILDGLMEKIKDEIEKGRGIKKELLEKLKEVREKMRELKLDYSKKAKEMLKMIRDHVRKILDDLLGGGSSKRSADEFDIVEQLAESRLRDLLLKLRDLLDKDIDKDALKKKIESIFGEGTLSNSILDLIHKKGAQWKELLRNIIDRFLERSQTRRSLKEWWKKIKDWFIDLHIDFKEKYAKFGEWVKENFEKAKLKGKDKIESIKNIAREFIDHAKGVREDIATEALEFLRPYKEDLGALWEKVKEEVNKIRNKEE